MSAICGAIDFSGFQPDVGIINSMAQASRHRGPDGSRFVTEDHANFCHQAFCITPESHWENQPLISEDGEILVIADARIDNREELIRTLDIKPKTVVTDVDLILAAWLHWDVNCCSHLLGDFVFAVWNRRKQQLFLARDPLGGFSVSWYSAGSIFYFASEISAILDSLETEPEINEIAVMRQLAGLPPDASETCFESIQYLPAGHFLIASKKGISKKRYWEPEPNHEIYYKNDNQYVDHFLEVLDQCVANRLRTTGPVGISLSGGNDSTLLAACAAKLLPDINPEYPELHAFSYTFQHYASCDESIYINAVVNQYNLIPHPVDGDKLWVFSDLPNRKVPLDHLSTDVYTQLPDAIAKAASRHGCQVLLNGHYGDDLFSGESTYAADMIRKKQFIRLFRLLKDEPSLAALYASLIQRGGRLLIPQQLRKLYRKLHPTSDPEPQIPGLNPNRLQRMMQLLRQSKDETAFCEAFTPSRKVACRGLLGAGWPNALHAGRSHLHNRFGVESASPYYDKRLVEYLLAIPSEQISRNGQPRRLQRAAMKQRLPDIVSNRQSKTLFNALLLDGLSNKKTLAMDRLMKDPLVLHHKWCDPSVFAALRDTTNPSIEQLFAFGNYCQLELWLKAIKERRSKGRSWSVPYQFNSNAQG